MAHVQLDNSLANITKHDIWNSGLGLCDANTALKPKFVLSDMIERDAEQKASDIFGWEADVVNNPPVMPSVTRTCQERFGGLCVRDTALAKAGFGVEGHISNSL